MTPPTHVPRRRWYHRYAVLEMSLLRPVDTVVSWHITRAGAAVAAGGLIAHHSAHGGADTGGVYVSDIRDFVALPVDHHRVMTANRS